MKRGSAFSLLLLASFALISCGDGLMLFSRSETSDLSITGPEDGAVLTTAQSVPLQISTADPGAHPNLDVQINLLSATGESVWEHQISAPALNEDFNLQLPDLPAGQYRLEIVVSQDGTQVAQRTTTIFSVNERPRIAGIASFPPLITTSSPVLLSAEVAADDGSDPWLRWTWRGKTIAQGSSSSGGTAVLWRAPADEGVYTVTLEVFPVAPPAGTAFSFRSSVVMSTDIYVSAGKVVRDELGPDASYLSLFHLQADLADAAAAARDLERAALPIGSLRVVPVGDGFGYRLEGGAGFRVPWPVLPVEDGSLAPFTLSAGIRPEQLTGADRIVAATVGSLTFTMGLGTDGSPDLAVVAPGSPQVTVPSGAAPLAPGSRYLVSVSIVPRLAGFSLQWFVDGRQVSGTGVDMPLPEAGGDGSAVVGGASGFVAVIDELGVYYRDEAGRPATDATLYRAAMHKQYGDRMLLADGLDGMFLLPGFTTAGKPTLDAGTLTLPPDASLELPPIPFPVEGFSVEFGLSRDSERSALTRFSWAGADAPFAEARLAADSGVLRLKFSGETVTALTTDGMRSWSIPEPPAEKAGIVVRAACPPDARAPLVIDWVLSLKENAKE